MSADDKTKFRALHQQGLSDTEIAAELGITRNAAIGRRTRMHLPVNRLTTTNRVRLNSENLARARAKAAIMRRMKQRRLPKPQEKPAYAPRAEPFTPLPDNAQPLITGGARAAVSALEANSCRWPTGDPKTADFGFCGRDHAKGLPYCEHHARMAFAPTGRSPGTTPTYDPRPKARTIMRSDARRVPVT